MDLCDLIVRASAGVLLAVPLWASVQGGDGTAPTADELMLVSDELRRAGDHAAAVELARLAADAAPLEARPQAVLALALSASGEAEAASTAMSRAMALSRADQAWTLHRTGCAVEGRPADAVRAALRDRAATLRTPQGARARAEALEQAWWLSPDPDEELDLALDAASALIEQRHVARAARVLNSAALWAFGDERRLLEDQRAAIAPILADRATELRGRAEELHSAGEFSAEARAWGDVSALSGEAPVPAFRAAKAHAAAGERWRAIGALKRAIDRGFDDGSALLNAWEFVAYARDPGFRSLVASVAGAEALVALDEAHDRFRDKVATSARAWLDQRRVARRRADGARAFEGLSEAIRRDPADAASMLLLAEMAVTLDRPAVAAPLLRAAVLAGVAGPQELRRDCWISLVLEPVVREAWESRLGDQDALELARFVSPQVPGFTEAGVTETGRPLRRHDGTGVLFALFLPVDGDPSAERFLLAASEVTRARFDGGASRLPVTGVTRVDALAWCERHGWSLPRLAEWAHASREAAPPDQVRSDGPSEVPEAPTGLACLLGNVAEWTLDGPTGSRGHVTGGSWRDRFPARHGVDAPSFPARRSAAWIGFRPVLRLDP